MAPMRWGDSIMRDLLWRPQLKRWQKMPSCCCCDDGISLKRLLCGSIDGELLYRDPLQYSQSTTTSWREKGIFPLWPPKPT